MILWAIIRNITWVVWLHLRSAHGLYLLWSWMYLLGSSYFACTVMVCFTLDKWILPPSKTIAFTDFLGKMLVAGTSQQAISRCCSLVSITDRWTIAAGWKFESSPVCGLAHRSSKNSQGRRFHPPPKTGEACGPSTLPGTFTVAKKNRHGVMDWLLPWSSLAAVSSWAYEQGPVDPSYLLYIGDSTIHIGIRFQDFDEPMSIV